jgi:hypothetical protein
MNPIHYQKENDYTPQEAQNEYVELLVKAGRRCAYDLSHAADSIEAPTYKEFARERAELWLKVFNPADDRKNYRHHLHNVIYELERQIDKLVARCAEHNVDVSDITSHEIPF